MGFIVATAKDDHAQEDAVRRGVADGLARLLEVPKHPDSVQAMLDRGASPEEGDVENPHQPAARFRTEMPSPPRGLLA